MINRLLSKLPGNRYGQRWSIWGQMTLVRPDGSVYLRRRRIIQTPWAAIYIHDILGRDHEDTPHSHPFPFYSLVLRGGYLERIHRPVGTSLGPACPVARGPWEGHCFPRGNGQVHVITAVQPATRTLVLAGRRKDSWGFFVDGTGIVHWKTYLEGQQREPLGGHLHSRAEPRSA